MKEKQKGVGVNNNNENKSKVIGIFSGKGGVGKTTTAILLGLVASKLGKDAVVVDGNLSSPEIHRWIKIGENGKEHKSIHGAIIGEYPVIEAIFPHESGTFFIPGTENIDYVSALDLFNVEKILQELKEFSEVIIVDAPPGYGSEAVAVMRGIDEAIIVVNPEPQAVHSSVQILKLLDMFRKRVLGLIIVENKKYGKYNMNEIKRTLGLRVIGHIKYNKNVIRAALKSDIKTLTKEKKIWNAYVNVADKILGISSIKEKESPLMKYVKRSLGLSK